MQQLKDKLAIAERAAKSEAQLKVKIPIILVLSAVIIFDIDLILIFFVYYQEKYHLRFKVLEERLKGYPNGINRSTSQGRTMSNGTLRRQSLGGSENLSKPSSNGILSRNGRLSASSRIINASSLLKQERDSSSSFESDGELSNGDRRVADSDRLLTNGKDTPPNNGITHPCENGNGVVLTEKLVNGYEDCVSGTLYDMLQKEVISLRKSCHEKDQSLKDKDDAIEVW